MSKNRDLKVEKVAKIVEQLDAEMLSLNNEVQSFVKE